MNGRNATMDKCAICNNDLPISKEDTLVINDVPENTFNFTTKTGSLQVVSCKVCGSVQLVNVPLSHDYDVVYRSIEVSVSYREDKKRQIKRFVKSYKLHDKCMIEVGCGNGQFLDIIRETGVSKIVGIESGKDHCSECSQKGFDVIHGNIIDVLKTKKMVGPFEAFVTFHYLEHLPNPAEFVTCLYKTVKPGGVGLIEVPNYDYIEKNNIWLEFTKDHRVYYRKRTLCYLLAKCGFSIEQIEENNGGICLTAVVRKPDSSDADFASMKNQIKKDIDKFKQLIERLNGSFAVYGAGHYSQLLINMIDRQYGIKPLHIFDSNRQKVGNKICDVVVEDREETEKMRDCNNIIVICGLYNDEVCRMLSSLNKNVIKWG
ncbi:MAG: class I SAM-dependent methyltransferase [Desulfobacterales bacterium]|nr:class I SAM-dependent methyltransferase [Desulfobacterales bacterium]